MSGSDEVHRDPAQLTSEWAEQAADLAGHGRELAQQKLSEAGESARSGIRDQLSVRSNQVGNEISEVAGSLHDFAGQLRNQGKDPHARITGKVADQAERLADYLTSSDPDSLLADLEELTRRQPWAAALGGALVGLIGARFLKASSRRRYEEGRSRSGRPQGPTRSDAPRDTEVTLPVDVAQQPSGDPDRPPLQAPSATAAGLPVGMASESER